MSGSQQMHFTGQHRYCACCWFHINTCDPIFINQYVVARTKVGEHKKCTDSPLLKVMHQISIHQELNVRTMIVFLKKVLPSRKSIDWRLINNVRICTLKTKNYMKNSSITIEPCYFATSFITEYRENYDNYSEGK